MVPKRSKPITFNLNKNIFFYFFIEFNRCVFRNTDTFCPRVAKSGTATQ